MKTATPYEKLIKDGQVAVLVSPGFGAGWSTWNSMHTGLVFDHEIVDALLAGDREQAGKIAERKYPDAYLGGLRDLCVRWVGVGSSFEITEYDGSETLHVIGKRAYHVA